MCKWDVHLVRHYPCIKISLYSEHKCISSSSSSISYALCKLYLPHKEVSGKRHAAAGTGGQHSATADGVHSCQSVQQGRSDGAQEVHDTGGGFVVQSEERANILDTV